MVEKFNEKDAKKSLFNSQMEFRKRSIVAMLMFFLFFSTALTAKGSSLYLKERFFESQPGDYVVVFQNRSYTLFHIYEKTPQSIIVEEITVPETQIPKQRKGKINTFSWKKWIQQADPRNTPWAMYEISLASGKINEYYSFTQREWRDISKIDNFLPILLNLKFSPVPEEKRKKIGAPPLAGDVDSRRLWQPPLVVEGRTRKNVFFEAWEASWPKDKSQLSSRKVLIYLLKDYPLAPLYFPYWIEIPDSPCEDKIRVIDAGKEMLSPIAGFPRRPM